MSESSEIQKFYEGQRVLVTGGTGFMGKILIEKLLRSTDVATIYLVIREKKGKDMHTRLDELFDDMIFERLKRERSKFKHRVVAVAGDCSITGLGMTLDDRQKLIETVNVVFHVAATVRFDENIKLAYSINVSGTSEALELSRQMKSLKSFMHVSTAYSNCHLTTIDETVYDYPVDYDDVGALIAKLSMDEATTLTPKLIGNWPNTYTFTKALAESLIKNKCGALPVGIFRPSIVLSTYKEPIEGWCENLFGPTGAVVAATSGLLRLQNCDDDMVADVVPVDTCVAGLIAAAWDVANRTKKRTSEDLPIFNYVSSVENSITWGEYNVLNHLNSDLTPLSNSIWVTRFQSIKNPITYFYLRILLHIVPALILDLFSTFAAQKPSLLTMYRKIHKFSDVVSFFCTRQWTFRNNNIQNLWQKMNDVDQQLFPMSIKTVSWLAYLRSYYKGLRVYLLRDPMENLDRAKARNKRFLIAHHLLKAVLYFGSVSSIWMVLVKFAQFFGNGDIVTLGLLPRNNTCDYLT